MAHRHLINIPRVRDSALRPSKVRQRKGNRAAEVSPETHKLSSRLYKFQAPGCLGDYILYATA